MRLSSVVLPEPLGPISATNSPRGTSSERSLSTSSRSLPRLKYLWMPVTRTMGEPLRSVIGFCVQSIDQTFHGAETDHEFLPTAPGPPVNWFAERSVVIQPFHGTVDDEHSSRNVSQRGRVAEDIRCEQYQQH